MAAQALEQAQALREALAASITPDADAGQRQHLQAVERNISRWVAAEAAIVKAAPTLSSAATFYVVNAVSVSVHKL